MTGRNSAAGSMSTETTLVASAPVLILKVGRYPLSHGVLGAVRSLGRAGISVYATCEDHFVPYAFSRFLSGSFMLPTIVREDRTDELVRQLAHIGRLLGRKTVLLPTDDEA